MGKKVNKNRLFHREAIYANKTLASTSKHCPPPCLAVVGGRALSWGAPQQVQGLPALGKPWAAPLGPWPTWGGAVSPGSLSCDIVISTCSMCVHVVPGASSIYKMASTTVFGKTFGVCFKNNTNKRMVTQPFRGCSGVVCTTRMQPTLKCKIPSTYGK